MAQPRDRVLEDLRARIVRLERPGRAERPILPFGIAAIDEHLPQGALVRGALHEVTGSGLGAPSTARRRYCSSPGCWPGSTGRCCGACGRAICSPRPWPGSGCTPIG